MKEGKLPEGWEWKRLGEVVVNYDNKRIPLKAEDRTRRKGSYPYCGANGVIDYIDDFLYNGEYVLLAEDGGYWGAGENSAYLMVGKFWVNNHAHILQAQKILAENSFLVKILNYLNLNKFISGTTRGKLTQGIMNNIEIPLPPLAIQRQIVAILEQAEAMKRLRAESDELTQRFLQSVFMEMFGDPVKNEKGWDVVKIRDIITGSQYGSSFLGSNDGKYPILGMNNITFEGKIELNNLKYVNLTENEFEKFRLQKGDILFNRTNAPNLVGKTGLYQKNDSFVFASYLIRLKLKTEIIAPEFLWKLLNSTYMKSKFSGMCKKAVNQANINAQELQSISIPLPPIPLQQEFTRIVEQVEGLRESQRQSAGEINLLFEGLMQKAFTGELVA